MIINYKRDVCSKNAFLKKKHYRFLALLRRATLFVNLNSLVYRSSLCTWITLLYETVDASRRITKCPKISFVVKHNTCSSVVFHVFHKSLTFSTRWFFSDSLGQTLNLKFLIAPPPPPTPSFCYILWKIIRRKIRITILSLIQFIPNI